MKNNYAYSEVLDVIENMEEKYREMLPLNLLQFLKENSESQYQKHVNPTKPLSKQTISKDAMTILAMINLKYWVKDEKRKAELIEKYKKNDNEFSTILLKNKLEKGEISISDLSDLELDEAIKYYNKIIKEKMKKI